jgi:hypothetical protein
MTKADYDRASGQVEERLDWPPEGLIAHVCFGSDGDLRVSEVWESREQLERFQDGLMPVLTDSGINVQGGAEPELLDVHAIQTREYSSEQPT